MKKMSRFFTVAFAVAILLSMSIPVLAEEGDATPSITPINEEITAVDDEIEPAGNDGEGEPADGEGGDDGQLEEDGVGGDNLEEEENPDTGVDFTMLQISGALMIAAILIVLLINRMLARSKG
jgi:hypothetical protein